jgi:hypothetical protein
MMCSVLYLYGTLLYPGYVLPIERLNSLNGVVKRKWKKKRSFLKAVTFVAVVPLAVVF